MNKKAMAGNIQDLVKELVPATDAKSKTYTAEVSHTDDEGIVWVRLPGAEQDTPTASTSSEVKMGDTVTVEWRNNKLYIAGNYTNPSAGVTRVSKVEQTAEKAMSDAETAQAAADSAQETANEAFKIAGDTDQHFWFTETGTDTGAHITEATQEDFLDDPANGGANLLARSNGIAVRDGLDELASFSASGASIGQDGELRFFVTPSSIALENDDDDPIFSVVEDAAGKIVRPAVVATFSDPTDVDTTTYTISDSITASGAVAVFFETGGDQYALDSTLTTTTVTVGTGVTVALTTDGVDYCQGLMTESEASGVLSVEYYITHYDKALLDMVGSINVDGVGDIIGVANTTWTASNQSDTFIGADNTKTGKGVRVGVGTGGQNRGLYDKTLDRWIIYNNTDGKTIINGNNAVLSAGGNLTIDGAVTLRKNNKSIYLTDAQNKTIPMMYINGNNAFSLGYGLYNASKGSTLIYGNDIAVRSKGDVNFNSSLTLDTNNTAIFFTDTNGTKYSQIYLSNADNFVLGRYMHDANKGSTQVYGHTLGFHSHSAITFDQPITVNGNVNGRNMDALLYRGHFSTTTHTASDVTVSANTDSGEKTATFTRSGYYPYAIAGWNLTGTNRMYQNLYEIDMSNRGSGTVTISYRFRNNASVQVTIGLKVQILWIQIL